MSDFLNFLNTADLDTLTKIPGVTLSTAENLIAAQPFDSEDDCLKVHGMTKKLLTRIRSAFEAAETSSESQTMITVEEEAMPAPLEKSLSTQETAGEAKPSFWSRLGQAFVNLLRAFLRLIITVIVIGGIGALIYFGLPFLNKKFFAPVEQNTVRISRLEDEIVSLQTQLNEMNTRVGAIEKTIEAHTASIAKLEEMQATLEQETATQNDRVMVVLKREITLTRAIETLSRSRLYLSQSNFGLAHDDVQATRDIMTGLLTDAPEYQVDALNQIIARLDLALGNLPSFPVVAVDDVDIAWQLMMRGLPESAADAMATSTPLATPTLTSTPTPEPILEVTPTVTP